MSVLTWLTVIVGWIVLADQQTFRELRKDRAARVNDLRASLQQIEKDAIAFHTAAQFSEADAFSLRRSIGLLSREISLLIQCKFISHECGLAVIELRETATDVGMDQKSFQQSAHQSELIGRIMAARQSLDDLLSFALVDTLLRNKSIIQSLTDCTLTGWEYSKPHRHRLVQWSKDVRGRFRSDDD